MKESLKKFREEAQKLEQSEKLKKAREKFEKIQAETEGASTVKKQFEKLKEKADEAGITKQGEVIKRRFLKQSVKQQKLCQNKLQNWQRQKCTKKCQREQKQLANRFLKKMILKTSHENYGSEKTW